MNKKDEPDLVAQNKTVTISRTGLLLRAAPVLAISIFLAYYLNINLLVVSGLVFCFFLYESTKTYKEENFRRVILIYFILSFVLTVGSKVLTFAKVIFVHQADLRDAIAKQIDLYKVCFLSASYQSFGFIRRGLIPTIVQAISKDYVFQVFFVQCLGYILFLTGVILISSDKFVRATERRIFTLVMLFTPIGVYGFFNFNLGFYDMIILGLLLISFRCRNSPWVFLIDLTGLLVHEAYLFLKLPFLILNILLCLREKKSIAPLIFLTAFNIVVFYAVIFWPRPSLDALWRNYYLHYPGLVSRTTPGDTEAFFPLSRDGKLSLQLKIIWNYLLSSKGISYYLSLPAMVLSVIVCSYASSNLEGRNRRLDTYAAAFVFLFPLALCIVGGDFGRWLAFSYVLWACYYFLVRPRLFPEARISYNGLYAILLIALIFSPFGINYNPLFFH